MDEAAAGGAGGATAGEAATRAFAMKWGKDKWDMTLPETATVGDMRAAIQARTRVRPAKQKLVGVPKKTASGAAVADDTPLSELKMKGSKPKITVVGNRDEDAHVAPSAEELDSLAPENDLDLPEDAELSVADRNNPLFLDRIAKRVENYKPKMLAGFRPGKKCLVLDIDYTLFDHRSVVESPLEQARPYLHEFLSSVFPYYNIVIWSATSMKWIELKMAEVGVTSHEGYKIAMFMDHGAMITVNSERYGLFNTKPLGVLWGQFSEFATPQNTIMFDDLGRNFLMNPENGLKIKPCRNLPVTRGEDRELVRLTEYLLMIKDLDTFEGLKHRKWKHYVKARKRRREADGDE